MNAEIGAVSTLIDQSRSKFVETTHKFVNQGNCILFAMLMGSLLPTDNINILLLEELHTLFWNRMERVDGQGFGQEHLPWAKYIARRVEGDDDLIVTETAVLYNSSDELLNFAVQSLRSPLQLLTVSVVINGVDPQQKEGHRLAVVDIVHDKQEVIVGGDLQYYRDIETFTHTKFHVTNGEATQASISVGDLVEEMNVYKQWRLQSYQYGSWIEPAKVITIQK